MHIPHSTESCSGPAKPVAALHSRQRSLSPHLRIDEAGQAALDFVATAAAGPGDLVSTDDGVPYKQQDALAAATALAWLPTLPGAAKRRLLARLDAVDRYREPDFVPRPDIEAASALAIWRTRGDLEALLRQGLTVLVESRAHGDVATSARILHPVLLAARLARSDLDAIIAPPPAAGWFRRRRAPRPVELVRHHLEMLTDHLVEADLDRGTRSCPSPNLLICQATELWRDSVPYTAAIRAPLEIVVRQRWREQQGAEDVSCLEYAALVTAAENLHLDIDFASAKNRLISHQAADGGFSAAPFTRSGAADRLLGARSLTTIFAARALLGQPRTSGARLR